MTFYYWLRRKLRALHTTTMLWLFFAWGKKLWPYIREQHNNHGRTTAMFFAQDEREMNIAARSYVEWLDHKDDRVELYGGRNQEQ